MIIADAGLVSNDQQHQKSNLFINQKPELSASRSQSRKEKRMKQTLSRSIIPVDDPNVFEKL
jgi:hypothetical protein